MNVWIIRHACAGHKESWEGPDEGRPLDPAGWKQAEALADLFDDVPISAMRTSPTARCEQTLQPMARRHGVVPTPDPVLVSTTDATTMLGHLLKHARREGDGNALFCTHGEVMTRVLDALRRERVRVRAEHDDDGWLLGKATAWLLEVDQQRVCTLVHHAPEPVAHCPEHPRGRSASATSP